MATNKTITPTNVTVQIPALADVPDISVVANAIDKTIDGVNTLNSQLIPSALSSATDFNTLTGSSNGKTTLYSGANISQMTNVPSYFSGQSWPFILEVRKISLYTQQILHVYSSTGNPVDTWVRNQSYVNGAVGWLGWEQMISTAQLKLNNVDSVYFDKTSNSLAIAFIIGTQRYTARFRIDTPMISLEDNTAGQVLWNIT